MDEQGAHGKSQTQTQKKTYRRQKHGQVTWEEY